MCPNIEANLTTPNIKIDQAVYAVGYKNTQTHALNTPEKQNPFGQTGKKQS